jgi:hypothetical protein
MATEEYSIGYDAGYQDGWNAAIDEEPKQEQSVSVGQPVCDKDPQGCYSVRCYLGNKCKNTPQTKQEQGEPVAKISRDGVLGVDFIDIERALKLPNGTKLYTTPQPNQDEVDIRSRLYQRVHELECLLKDIAEYTGEGPITTDWQGIVKLISDSARNALEDK